MTVDAPLGTTLFIALTVFLHKSNLVLVQQLRFL